MNLPIEPKVTADEVLSHATSSAGGPLAEVNISKWSDVQVRELFDHVIQNAQPHQLRGIRVDQHGFLKLGIPWEHQDNSGLYKGVIVVLSVEAFPDRVQFVFNPA